MDKRTSTAVASAPGRGSVTRISAPRRTSIPTDRAREARRSLKPRSERFAHLKRMHD